MQFIRLDAVQRGELAQLRAAEALDAMPRAAGRGDAGRRSTSTNWCCAWRRDRIRRPNCSTRMRCVRSRLATEPSLAWTLAPIRARPARGARCRLSLRRRWRRHADRCRGALSAGCRARAASPAQRSRPRRPQRRRHRARAAGAGARTPCPMRDDLAGLRRALRPVLLHLLGGRALKSWDLLGDLARLATEARRRADRVASRLRSRRPPIGAQGVRRRRRGSGPARTPIADRLPARAPLRPAVPRRRIRNSPATCAARARPQARRRAPAHPRRHGAGLASSSRNSRRNATTCDCSPFSADSAAASSQCGSFAHRRGSPSVTARSKPSARQIAVCNAIIGNGFTSTSANPAASNAS